MPKTSKSKDAQLDKPPVRILGIETSCDETAAAVVEDGRLILSSVVASQIDLHAPFGGVFPEVASRQHIKTIYPVIDQALQQAHMTLGDLDAIAVTRGPGLPGSLVVGMNAAKGLVLGRSMPILGISHLEGHLYSAWLYKPDTNPPHEPKFPLIALIVSGGHTELVLMKGHLQYEHLGATLDDAAGEAFDKVARLLGLEYPGGPSIQNASVDGNPLAYNFPRAWLEDSWDFSFSGLKTAVMREVRQMEPSKKSLPVADLAASFQAAVVDVLVTKTIKAAKQYSAKNLLIAGGVSANRALRHSIQIRATCPLHIPPIWLCTDNAAMIAGAAYFRYIQGQRDQLNMDVFPNWPLSEVPAPTST
ncbi:MAG: tRNA (adenosine(37)-N6)-threonylcarbamoyltransferase complex transferase subunit TsaD [Chloroflexi bacterium RBG_19FT_COMBO_50_10]|nr:MAG: tRNA (adenosine(37)-N6)-threonylcarbamoyltransferase complex transferase subunit TsaD [Chloroflexi bacterium RBG_19FT_COMBO_50_10]